MLAHCLHFSHGGHSPTCYDIHTHIHQKKHMDSGIVQRETRAMYQGQGLSNIVQVLPHFVEDVRLTGYGSIFMQQRELGDLGGVIQQYKVHKEFLRDEGFLWKVTVQRPDCAVSFVHRS
jgi:hypothetical protein